MQLLALQPGKSGGAQGWTAVVHFVSPDGSTTLTSPEEVAAVLAGRPVASGSKRKRKAPEPAGGLAVGMDHDALAEKIAQVGGGCTI
jgi:hypothetical protein